MDFSACRRITDEIVHGYSQFSRVADATAIAFQTSP
jgi:hypothetical protein